MRLTTTLVILLLSVAPLLAQQPPDPHSVPVVDAALGSCSADFTITGTDSKPVYNAKIDVRVQYGVFHRLDLEVGTNIDGKARFAGLPSNPKRGLFYRASEGDRSGNAFQDPSEKCKAEFTVALRKQSQPQEPDK